MVVGTRKATCFPLSIALNAALIAISVLPKPTSPQLNDPWDFQIPCQI